MGVKVYYIDKMLSFLNCQRAGFLYDNIVDSFEVDLESMKMLEAFQICEKGR
jgi:hypothetical protein